MRVLVDTSVWSLGLRRRSPPGGPHQTELAELIQEGRVVMLGPIRQELLSGVKSAEHFQLVKNHLRAFPDHPLTPDDYEDAAVCFNRCRAEGVQGSNTDFLVCAVALRHGLAVFTTDRDFQRYASVLGLRLHAARN